MNVIYSLSHQEDWIGFAKEMHKRLGWMPNYWLTTNVTDHLVNNSFPDCIRHKYLDIIRGISPSGINLFQPSSIDENAIHDYACEMDQAMKMMDRLDSGDAFSYNERKRYFIKILNYANNVLEFFKPEVAVFTETPHHVTQYILYVVLKKNGVKTLMFKPVLLHDLRILIYNSIQDDPFKSLPSLIISVAPNFDTSNEIRNYIKRLQSEYKVAVPAYMNEVLKKNNFLLIITKTVIKLLRRGSILILIDREKTTNVLKLKNHNIETSTPNRLQLYWLKLKGSLKNIKLRNAYSRLITQNIDLTIPYVFVSLHYQPERTTSPDGGVYVDQFLMINLLRKQLPHSVSIYVKEHPFQFYPKIDGHLSRFKYNYEDIASLENVHLISESFSSFKLIDHSLCVATVTGTVGLEAVARKKPVLVFGGGCWYRSLPGAFYTPNAEALHNAISLILKEGYIFNDNDVYDFLIRFHEISFKAKLAPHYPVNLSQSDNIENLSNAVEKYYRAVFTIHE